MASNDGQRLIVLGLSFRNHHTLHMQQVLRSYNRLPERPNDRGALFTGLFEFSKDLDEEETRNIEHWLKNGGEFPAPTTTITNNIQDIEDEEWPEYRPEDFESDNEEGADYESSGDEESSSDRNRSVDEEGLVEEERYIDEERSSEEEGSVDDERSIEEERSVEEEESSDEEGSVEEERSIDEERSNDEEEMECDICAEGYSPSEFPPSTNITSTCNHKNEERVCVYCLQQSIESAVTEGQLNLIVCPFCPEMLSRTEVKTYATRAVFARYDYLVQRAKPDVILCLGVDCGSGQVHVGEDLCMICEVCSFKTCPVHKLPWHEGMTCEEFDCDEAQIERLEQAEATAKLLAKEHAQVCPNCHEGVSRSDGCDHMTCRCGMEWCYVCGASYENIKRLGDEAHAATCTYHPRRVQMRRDQKQAHQGQLTQLVHGRPVSDTLKRARGARNERIRADIRPKAAEAAEKRRKEMEQKKEEGQQDKKRRLHLHPPWEEK